VTALYFAPRYLKMGLTTIPEFLEKRFDPMLRNLIAMLLIISFVCTLLPIVLYTGAINIESIFDLSEMLGISKNQGLWLTVLVVGSLGAIYAIFGGLKMVALTDTLNGYGLLIAGLAVPFIALWNIGEGSIIEGLTKVYEHAPQKFNVISDEVSLGSGSRESILPFEVLFTGLIINQLYFWCMNQTLVQRVFGAISLKEAQKGLLYTGILKILIPLVIVLPGIIAYYYFGDVYYEEQDIIYPLLVKKVLPLWATGFFVAVVVGAILSTFNSALNSAATIFSLDLYKKYVEPQASEKRIVWIGKTTSAVLAVFAIAIAPLVANAPEGLYQLLQQLNGIFFIPMASVILAGFFFKKVSAQGAKAGLIFGLAFYIIMYYVVKADIHFIHIWGIEFVLNVIVMHAYSLLYPRQNNFVITDVGAVNLAEWKYAKIVSAVLVVITLLIYILLGTNG
ncbi:MAG: solute:sodium symporter family transporter, partial [Bacteroidota bacterium]